MTPVLARGKLVVVIAALGLVASLSRAEPADLSLPVSGELLGTVVDSAGIPQMGASVELLNKYQRSIARTITNVNGRFAFADLAADTYSIRVSLASFLPAFRNAVLVKVGVDSVLQIHLATFLSNVEVSYRVPDDAMSEEWKWVLRSSPATRPINRLVELEPAAKETKYHPHIFSGTHAMLAVSGGDGGLVDSDEIAGDMGTSFAVSTNVFGSNQVQVAGTFGQNAEFGPAAMALCAIYSRTDDALFGAPPEVTLNIAQLGGIGSQLNGIPVNGANAGSVAFPVLRTMSLSVYQVADPLDNVHIEYGATGESVEYGQHASRLSPFARVTVDLGAKTSIVAAYSDGGRPDELIAHQQYEQAKVDGSGDDLSEPLDSLSRLPQIGRSNGRLELERTRNYELGASKTVGSRVFAVSGFYENVSNGRINVAGDLSDLEPGNLFSDGISTTSFYNLGRYQRRGYLASFTQRLGSSLEVGMAYGRMGGFAANSGADGKTPWSASSFLEDKSSNLATASVRATIPHAGTRISADYGWIDPRTAVPIHVYTTQNVVALPGFNILVRQPLPSPFGMPGHFELTADLRNLLADGYTPVNTGDGQRMLVVEAPRAIRGGLKFTF